MAFSGVVYGIEPGLSTAEFRRILIASGHAEHRPAEDHERLERLLRSASLIVTARAYTPERALLGIARVVSDFSDCAYVSDLAVAQSQRRNGIGRGLLATMREKLGQEIGVLIATPINADFCERVGMERLPHAYRLGPG